MHFQDQLSSDETQKSRGEGRGKQKPNETKWGSAPSQGPAPCSPRLAMKRKFA